MGLATFDGDLASLAARGVLAIYGQASGPIPAFETARLIAAGSAYLTRTSLIHYANSPEELKSRADEVLNAIASRELAVHIGGRYALADAKLAHAELEGRRSTGKLLLIP